MALIVAILLCAQAVLSWFGSDYNVAIGFWIAAGLFWIADAIRDLKER